MHAFFFFFFFYSSSLSPPILPFIPLPPAPPKSRHHHVPCPYAKRRPPVPSSLNPVATSQLPLTIVAPLPNRAKSVWQLGRLLRSRVGFAHLHAGIGDRSRLVRFKGLLLALGYWGRMAQCDWVWIGGSIPLRCGVGVVVMSPLGLWSRRGNMAASIIGFVCKCWWCFVDVQGWVSIGLGPTTIVFLLPVNQSCRTPKWC